MNKKNKIISTTLFLVAFIFLPHFTLADEPAYEWVKAVGGTISDNSYSVTTDSSGNVYISGSFQNTVDFDPGVGIDNKTSKGNEDAFLSKYDSSGVYQWTKTWGGVLNDYSYSVATDSFGNVYVAGAFEDTVDFDPGVGIDNKTGAGFSGVSDVFFSKFNSSGTYSWTRTWGENSVDVANSLSVDSSDNIYVSGYFHGTVDFDPGAGTTEKISTLNKSDAYLSKFNSAGVLSWNKTWGGSDTYNLATSIDSSGNVYVTGNFDGTVDFDPGAGTANKTSAGDRDAYLSKFNSDGVLSWNKTWGDVFGDFGRSVAIDSSGNVYVTGNFGGTVDFDPSVGTDEKTTAGSVDAYLTKYDSSGTYGWTKTWGGTGADYGYAVATDSFGNVYVTGDFRNTVDFDPGTGIDEKISAGSSDVFLFKCNSSGSYLWTKTWGDTGSDYGYSVSVDPSENVYVTGYFEDTVDFDPGAGIDEETSAGSSDVFLVKYLAPTEEESAENAKITSWKAEEYMNSNVRCQQRLKLTVKGKHFDKNAKVMIGNKESSSVEKKSSKMIVAKFCLVKLLNIKTDLDRSITVTNPDADKKKAKKKIDLGDLNSDLNFSTNDLNPQIMEGIKNIQKKLVELKLLDNQYITGVYGPITTEAVKKFQEQNNLPTTGFVGPLTKEKLGNK